MFLLAPLVLPLSSMNIIMLFPVCQPVLFIVSCIIELIFGVVYFVDVVNAGIVFQLTKVFVLGLEKKSVAVVNVVGLSFACVLNLAFTVFCVSVSSEVIDSVAFSIVLPWGIWMFWNLSPVVYDPTTVEFPILMYPAFLIIESW